MGERDYCISADILCVMIYAYMHVTGITHRPLNIENIMLKVFIHKTMIFIEPNPHTVLLTLFKK